VGLVTVPNSIDIELVYEVEEANTPVILIVRVLVLITQLEVY
jgi:hypothetical protein